MAQVQRLGLVMLGLILVTALLVKYLLPYLTPFVVALLLASLIDPAVDYLDQHLPISRGSAVIIVLLVVLVIVVCFFSLLVINISAELTDLLQRLPSYSENLSYYWTKWWDRVRSIYHSLDALPEPLAKIGQNTLSRLASIVEDAALVFLDIVKAVPRFFLTLTIASVATFFISRDKLGFFQFFLSLLPNQWKSDANRVKSEISTGILGFLRSQIILVTITSTLAITGLLVLKVPYPWILGFLSGLFDVMPMIGPGAVFLPLALYYTGIGRAEQGLAVLAVLAIILLVRQLSEPHIVASNVGLHPLTSLVAIYLGTQFLGVTGFILGPLTMVVLKAFFVVLIQPRLEQ